MSSHQRPFDSASKLSEQLDVEFALQATGLGVWELDPATRQVRWDDRCRDLFGLAKENYLPYEQAIRHIHPDDVARVDAAVQQAMNPQADGQYDQTYRTIGANDGGLRWVRFYGRAYFSEAGAVYRFAGVAQDVTQAVLDQQQAGTDLKQAQDRVGQREAHFRTLIEEAPVATCLFVGPEMRIDIANQAMIQVWGKGPDVIGLPLVEALPELKEQHFLTTLADLFVTGNTYQATGGRADLMVEGRLQTFYFNYDFKPLRNSSGEVYAILETATDVTGQVLAQQRIEQSQRQLLDLFEQSPVALAIYSADEAYVIEWANTFFGKLVARPPHALVGKPLLEAIPELKNQGFEALLKAVIATGEPYVVPEQPVDILRDGQLTTIYVNLTYQPRKGTAGLIENILVVATDVTPQVLVRQKVEESEARFRAIIEQAPVAMNISKGPDHVIELANERMFALWGREPHTVLNKPTFEAFPEAAGQGFEAILDQVYHTGETYRANEMAATLSRKGVLETIYLDLLYEPFRDEAGTIIGLMQVAIDVTGQLLARQEKAELEARLQTIITNLPSATVVFKGRNLVVESPSKYFIDIIDRGPDVTGKPLGELMPELESQSFLAILDQVYTSGQAFRAFGAPVDIRQADGSVSRDFFDLIYTPLLDAQGQPYAILSVATNVTDVIRAHQQLQESEERYRRLSIQLEEQVQQRTEELATINGKLVTTNKELSASLNEYATLNNELQETNFLLNRSNDNLQQFAYVASHDLQEPLRKIQSFGGLLISQYAGPLGEGADLLERMQGAASRMSTLIRDLLSYSRLTAQRDKNIPVALNQVVDEVLTDLELLLEETQARIDVGPLPVVEGNAGQLGQLVQNLLSNALKFRRPDTAPHIQIRADRITVADLPPAIKPAWMVPTYHRIGVTDNGIGFDDRYIDRIFQVFQRLHGKSQYAGTGIGLAICEKVATNHGGAITARSQPGQGATFVIYLPA